VFGVDGSGGAAAADAFLEWLAERGRGSYTQRSYAFALAHFLRWLGGRGIALDDVDRVAVVAYVSEFRRGQGDGVAAGRAPRTVNHRLSVLASFFEFLIDSGTSGWAARGSPVPGGGRVLAGHGMPGRDAPLRGRRSELRQRVALVMPARVEADVAVRLIAAAVSRRDRALLTLLWRTGQRIGDWSQVHGRHGVLGMRLADLDRRAGTIVVRLKGARDEHRVPVSSDFWPLFADYVREERGLGAPEDPAWIGLRRGRGGPLSYAAFESQLRYLGAKVGVRVTAHMFRHALAQALVDTAGLKVAQEVLGHAHVSTTARSYARVDEAAMVRALEAARQVMDASEPRPRPDGEPGAAGFVFPYDADTLAELDAAADQQPTRR
jgi:site-specific recombinase XerD